MHNSFQQFLCSSFNDFSPLHCEKIYLHIQNIALSHETWMFTSSVHFICSVLNYSLFFSKILRNLIFQWIHNQLISLNLFWNLGSYLQEYTLELNRLKETKTKSKNRNKNENTRLFTVKPKFLHTLGNSLGTSKIRFNYL